MHSENMLYYGDNLEILRNRDFFNDETVDLIYLDPPFNSKRAYNLLFTTPKGFRSDAQIEAFEDSWSWGPQAEQEFDQIKHCSNTDVSEIMSALRSFLGNSDMMAYLTMMANRLLELHRVLKPTGSLYIHCDPTASHYLKVVLDGVFGKVLFKNEIAWQRVLVKGDARKKYGTLHDILFFYTKTQTYHFEIPRRAADGEYLSRFDLDDNDGRGPYHSAPLDSPNTRPNLTYAYKGYPPPDKGWRVDPTEMKRLDAAGRLIFPLLRTGRIRRKLFLSDAPGPPVGDIWTDIPGVGGSGMGYPTEKPLALLQRIISASSKPGDVVLDPFCGCGTAVHAAQGLGRRWIGIDITHLAIALIERRMKEAFPGVLYTVEGTPKDIDGARDLARRDKYQFQHWATAIVGAQSYKNKKKGADGGIDGLIFPEEGPGNHSKIIVSVKGGDTVGDTMLKDLIATVEHEKAQMGLFVTLARPTKPMKVRAAAAGFYTARNGMQYPRIQILAIEDILSGKVRPEYFNSSGGSAGFKRAKLHLKDSRDKQISLLAQGSGPSDEEIEDDD